MNRALKKWLRKFNLIRHPRITPLAEEPTIVPPAPPIVSSTPVIITHDDVETIEQLDQGSVSIVSRVKWNGKQVVQKAFADQYEFDCEKEMLLNVSHPNIIKLLAYTENASFNILILEWMVRGSLQDYLDNNQGRARIKSLYKPFSRDIAKGLVYLHAMNIIHMDIKAPNILLNENMHAIICDFNLAISLPEGIESYQSSARLGSPLYSAPEMTNPVFVLPSQPVYQYNTAYDIYPLGWIMYLCQTANQIDPFEELAEGGQAQILRAHALGLLPSIPRSMKSRDLITWCWQKDPQDRPTAKQIVERLEGDGFEQMRRSHAHQPQ